MDRNFGGAIWTNHALQRLRERGISQSDAWATFNRPEQSRKAASQGGWVYYRTYGSEKIEVVAKEERGNWLILSVWSRPIYESSRHARSGPEGILEKILQFLLGWMRKSK